MQDRLTILGLLFEGSDPSAALIRGEEIVAIAEEERFSRDKHASGAFPIQATEFCLKQAGISIDELDAIAIGWDVTKFPEAIDTFYKSTVKEHAPLSRKSLEWQDKNRNRYTRDALMEQLEEALFQDIAEADRPEIHFIHHHYAHACSAFMLSGFEESLVITADGHGEEDCTHLWEADADGIRDLGQWNIPHSLGWFYTKFTQFFGFQAHDGEGKLMGLAAYGKPDAELTAKLDKIIRLTGDEQIYELESRFFLGKFVEGTHYTQEWIEIFGEPLERDDDRLLNQPTKDLAYAIQKRLEDIGIALAKNGLERTGKKQISVAGGSFMNCKMNGELAKLVGFDNFFSMPMAGDNGISIGAALAVRLNKRLPWRTQLEHLYYGPAFSNSEIEEALSEGGLEFTKRDDLPQEAARLLAESKVIGWFQGRMEAGARALGNRSILGNPLDPAIRDIINAKVKFRELWRPFCPSTTVEDGPSYFDYAGLLPFMIVACNAREGQDEIMPSVVHCDNTVRVQSVTKAANFPYHSLISKFRELTGIGVVLNTSFNVKGEPIVCTPKEAVNCYLKTSIDYLAIGDYLAWKD